MPTNYGQRNRPLRGTQIAGDNLPWTTVALDDTSLSAEWTGAHGAGFLGGDLLYKAADRTVNSLNQLAFSGAPPAINVEPAAGDSTGSFSAYNPEGGEYDEDPLLYSDRPIHSLDVLNPSGDASSPSSPYHRFNVLGQYDPGCVSKASELSKGAFDVYANPDTTTADGRHLGPNASITNFVTPMPMMMTNLAGGAYFADPRYFANGKGPAFISVIRVKVSNTSIPGPISEKRLQAVAAAIHKRTGLAVDIIKGSSTETMSIRVPAGYLGRPALTVHQDWLKENVAINFYNAINSTTVVMSIVVAVVAVERHAMEPGAVT